MTICKSVVSAAFCMALLFMSALVGADEKFNDLVKACEDCHGKDGISDDKEFPTIAGLSELYLIDSIEAFAEGDRPVKNVKRENKEDTDMKKISKELSLEEIERISEYFSQKPYKAVKQDFDLELAAAGKSLHDKYCEKCHENAGRSPDDDAGFLGGQHVDYLKSELDHVMSGKRDAGKKMGEKMRLLLDKEGQASIGLLLNYYASIQQED